MRAKKRVVTSGGGKAPGRKRRPTVRRIQPAIVPVPARRSPPPPLSVAPTASAEAGSAAVDLAVELGRGLRLASPLIAAAGCFGYGVELGAGVDLGGLGAIVTRSTTARPRPGNPPPRALEVAGGLVNAVGLQNPGAEAIESRYAALWAERDVPVIVSVAGGSVGEYVEVVRRLEGLPGIAGWELNLSCPNSARSGTIFGLEAEAAAALVGAVRRATELPLLAKLSPLASDPRPIARALEAAGADGLTAVNTLPVLAPGPGGRPALGGRYGGLSGPALRPVALRVVHEIAQVVDVPIVGVGGVTDVDDLLDFLAVGAAAVGVGTALLADPLLGARLASGLEAECRSRGLASYQQLVGVALPGRRDQPAARGAEYRP